MPLTLDDIAVLIDAISAWQSQDGTMDMLGDILAMGLGEPKERTEERREKNKAEKETTKRLKEEKAILLKAKLIGMKDALIADGALSR